MKIGTSGFRGIIADEFTREEVCKIIECTCKIIEKNNFKRLVVVGYDNRFMSDIFAKYAVGVFSAHGIKSFLTPTSVASPVISFAGKYEDCDLSIIITASHNPYVYNGIKIFSKNGQDLSLDIERQYNKYLPKIKRFKYLSFDECVNRNLIEYKDYTKQYVNNILSLLKYKDIKLKTMFNVMSGSSLNGIVELKNKLKLDVEIVNTHRDPLFNYGAPIPSEENLKEFRKIALKNKIDFAFATDGDGDRVAVIDEKGNYLNGNEIASLIYYFAVKEKGLKGGFVKNYSFSLLIDKICKKYNCELFETPVGFKYISQKLIDTNSLVGAENSGCEIKGNVYTKDGLVLYALLLEIVNFYKKPLSKIVSDLKKDVGYKMYYKEYSFKVKNKQKIIKYLQTNNPQFKKQVISTGNLDGFKYFFVDGTWALIRFSGTENLLRLVCEVNIEQEMSEVISYLENFANEISEK